MGVLEKIKVCISSLKVKRGVKIEVGTSPDPEDVEFLERELGIYPKSDTEG